MKGVTENGEGDFYGVIENIFEIEYNYLDYKKTVVLFYCKWFDPSNRGTRYDSKTNTVDIKMNKHYPLYDPFAMAHNVRQVHYVPYPSTTRDKRGWCAAITSKPRGLIEKNEIDEREDEPYQEDEMSNVDDVIAVETFNQLCVQEEAEEVPSDGDVDEEDVEANGDDEGSDDEDSQVTWLNHHTATIEAIFNKKATKRLSTLLFEARKKVKKDPSKPPLWLAGNSYPMLCLKWEEKEYKAKCQKNKANRNTDEANRACVHSGGSKSAGTLRLEFIQQFGRPPTFMEMNDLMHKYADSGEWTGARAQEVSEFFAQQRASAGVGSSSQGSARQNQNAGEQEYRPDLNSMVNLNQLPEYREGDPVLSMSIEDMSQMLNEPIHLQFFDPVGQTSGSSSGGSGRNNQQTAFTEYHRQRSSNPYQQDFIIPHDNPNQPQDNFFPNQASFDPNQAPTNFVHRPVARPPRTSLPPVIINEGGRGRGQGRPRQPTYSGKGKRPLYQPPDQP
ncbi:unnamed protein product [Trifolium pratense]|uniref:Uncharacterized protein n=1 Tax=Trifolium pratense TaxID=57577 RepID=A0ACB0IZM0_TRIPR|nr:unnamed protein product [Trifolium pratense]